MKYSNYPPAHRDVTEGPATSESRTVQNECT